MMNLHASQHVRLGLALAVVGLTLTAAGCKETKKVDGQLGDLGRLEFSYTRSCFFGCLIEQPLLSGTRESIKLQGDGADQPKLTVRSEEEDVAEVALDRQCYCERKDETGRIDVALDGMCEEPWRMACENTIRVGAIEPGEALVVVENEAGDTVDTITVTVKDASRARFFGTLPGELGEVDDDTFTLPADSRLEVRLELYDEDGIELLAPEGVLWRTGDPDVATLNAFLIGAGAEVDAGRAITVETHAAGETSIEIDVPGLTASIELEVEAP